MIAVSLPRCDSQERNCSVTATLGIDAEIECPLRGDIDTIEWLFDEREVNLSTKYAIRDVVSDA